jgi:hypothetical protein
MNANFLGAPSREEIRVLEQLRGQIITTVKAIERLEQDAAQKLHRDGSAVDYPHIARTHALITAQLSSIHLLINGGPNQESKAVRYTRLVPVKDPITGKNKVDAQGNEEKVEKEEKRRELVIVEHERNAERIGALHTFPNGLLPMNANGGMAAGMAGTLLRKRLEPVEEAWIEERVRKAGEWCFIPEEWGVEAKKADAGKEEDGNESEEEKIDEADRLESENFLTTRVRATLGEDEIMDLWQHAHQEVFDKAYLQRTYGGDLPEEEVQAGPEGEEGEEEEGDDEDDEEFEDAMDTSGDAVKEDEKVVVVVKRKVLAGIPVHQPAPGLPVQSFSVAHKFREIGDV